MTGSYGFSFASTLCVSQCNYVIDIHQFAENVFILLSGVDMLRSMISRWVLYSGLILFCFHFTGCAAYEHGYTTSQYKGLWLPISEKGLSSMPGDVRLKIERSSDRRLDNFISSKGLPNYIHVIDIDSLDLVYLEENKVYLFKRKGLTNLSDLDRTYSAEEVIQAGHIKRNKDFVKSKAEVTDLSHVGKIPPDDSNSEQSKDSDTNFLDNMLQRKWAVIIGISEYQYVGKNGLTNLVFADNDAISFAQSLRNLGWNSSHMKLLVNEQATERNIRLALESWLTKAGPEDQIILFWAGHGYPDPENAEKVYLATYDTDMSMPASGYRMDRVRSTLEEIGAKNVLLFADTCHAGKLITRGQRGISIIPQIIKMQRDLQVPNGWIFMVGADTDRQAIENTSWKNGAFTHTLLKGLQGDADGFLSSGTKDNIVTMGELKAYINTEMPNETQNILGVALRPVIATSTGDPDIWNMTLNVK